MDDKKLESITKKEAPLFKSCFNDFKTKAKVLDVYDGDTITIAFDFGNKYYSWKARIYGIDTPEIRTKNIKEKEAAYRAKEFLKNLILDKVVKIECMGFGKFGRILVKVFVKDEQDKYQDVSQMLIKEDLAHMYYGKKKLKWNFD